MLKKLRKKMRKSAAVGVATTLILSGAFQANVAFAQGELNAELVAQQGSTVSGRPGETIQVPVNIYVTPYGTDDTSEVTVTASFSGMPSKQVTFSANEFNVKKQVLLDYTIPQSTATSISARVNMTSSISTGKTGVSDQTADNVTINVIQAPVDTTPPTVTVGTMNAFYNYSSLPKTFNFTLDETSEVYVNNVSYGTFLAGTNTLSMPPSIEGNNTVTLKAKDSAGNISTPTSFSYFYDTINPFVAATADRPADSAGWYNHDVMVSFNASDINGSGIGSPVPSVVVSSEGRDQVITGSATDRAGNNGTGSITLNIDKTAPTISGAATTEPNSFGWYKNDVIVHFDGSDDLSGIASVSPDVTVSGEGSNLSATGTATDVAGNNQSATVSGINIDKTAPTISGAADREANSLGWYNNNVTVTFTGTDALSGINTVSNPVTLSNEGAGQSVVGTATDKAGNSQLTSVTGISIDKTAPIISGAATTKPNENGWYQNDVTVKFTASDALSGLKDTPAEEIVTFNTDGSNLSVSRTAYDNADNEATASVTGIRIDKTAPNLEGFENGATFMLNQLVNWQASDALSGLDTVESGTLDTSKIGTYQVVVKDKAGNTTTKSYKVTYDFGEVLNPIKTNGSSVFKAGSTVPVKFQLTDAQGAFVTDATAFIYFTKYTPAILGTDEEAVSTSAATTGNLFRYDFTSNQYIFNLNTKGFTPGTYFITIKLDDTTTQTVQISLK